ncbi:MAG: CoA ester lyase [Hyphomonas sp.]|uniref:CoA ester lyase n=1 Tax=Hyphomonas sp. TaxID=87 RepID=UPI0034A000B5
MFVYRSFLFVPGARSDRFGKAVAAGADAVIIDLEDAVLPADKAQARTDTLTWIGAWRGRHLGLRINSPRTAFGCADLAALSGSGAAARADFLIVPKADTPVDLEIVAEALGRKIPLIPIIESGRALSNAFEIAKLATGGMLFGGVDYSASLGADLSDWDAMLTARGTIAAACGAVGVPAYDVPFLDTADTDGLTASTRKAKAMGFSGRACIHPAQVEAVNAAYTPTAEEVTDARAILAAMEAAGSGAALHKGKMIDRPVVLAAERILASVRAT